MSLRPWVPDWIRRRWALLRHFRVIPLRTTVALTLALLAASLTGPALAMATGLLVGRTVEVSRGADLSVVILPLVVIGAMIAYQLVSGPVVDPVRARAVALVDGAVASRVRQAIGDRPGIAHLEDQAYRDLAALPTTGYESIGSALQAQLAVVTRYVGALTSAAIVAAVSPVAAVGAFGVLVAKRLYLRRIYAAVLADSGRSMMPQLRMAAYWQHVGATGVGAKEVRLFGFGDSAVERFDTNGRVMGDALAGTFRKAATRAWPAWAAEGVAVGLPLAFIVDAALDGDLSVGRVAIVLGAVLSMRDIGGVGNETYMVEATLTSVEALDRLEVLSAEGIAKALRRPSTDRPPLIKFENVAFTYPGAEHPVFEHLNLDVLPGQSIAIVGENGAGKSTLIKLLCRFYEPTAGRILADGVDIQEFGPDEWRARLAVVFQDFTRFHLSVSHNIALADWGHPEHDRLVAAAVDAAGARPVIDELPHGLDTILSRAYRNGADLSGGQWQRIALARALYAAGTGAQVLVLDEPTAHLDVGAELALFDQLLDHSSGKTAIVVSHRYSTVRRASRIVVLDAGQVIEDGSHEELVTLRGVYAELYALQADAFVEGLR